MVYSTDHVRGEPLILSRSNLLISFAGIFLSWSAGSDEKRSCSSADKVSPLGPARSAWAAHPAPGIASRHEPNASGYGVQGTGFRVQGSGFRVQGSGFRVRGSGFGVQDLGLRA